MYLRRIAATAIGRVPRVHSAASLPFATGPAAVDPGAAPDTGTAEQSVHSRQPGTRIDRPETRGDSSGAPADPGHTPAPVRLRLRRSAPGSRAAAASWCGNAAG